MIELCQSKNMFFYPFPHAESNRIWKKFLRRMDYNYRLAVIVL